MIAGYLAIEPSNTRSKVLSGYYSPEADSFASVVLQNRNPFPVCSSDLPDLQELQVSWRQRRPNKVMIPGTLYHATLMILLLANLAATKG
jgi:hypothetical protein